MIGTGFRHAGAAALAAALVAAGCKPSLEQVAAEQRDVVTRYCTDCHNAAEREADLSLENLDLAHPEANSAVWEKVLRKLDVGLMPPPGEPRPDAATVAALVAHLEGQLDAAAVAAPRPGRQPVHRLNRAEYGNAVRDLLGFTVDVESLLPADSSSSGFDNISDVLKTSPLLLERYLAVGLRVAATAVGDVTVEARTAHYEPRPDLSQNRWIEGLPLGTRGGLVVEHYFPVDGQYEFRPELWEAAASTVRGLEGFTTPFEFEMLLDGEPVHRAPIGGVEDDALSNRDQGTATRTAQERLRVTLPVKAGVHSLGFTFVMKSFAIEQRLLQPFRSDLPLGNDAYGMPTAGRGLRACRSRARSRRRVPATRRCGAPSSRALPAKASSISIARSESSPAWRSARTVASRPKRICKRCSSSTSRAVAAVASSSAAFNSRLRES